jgi:hypothetical protein
LQDNLQSLSNIQVTAGTFNANGHNLTLSSLLQSIATVTRVINMGSGTWSFAGTGALLNLTTTGLTLNANTSTIAITDTSSTAKSFPGLGLTYNNLSIIGGGSGAVSFTGANIFNAVTINGPKTVTLPASTITTLTTFTASGSSGNIVTVNSSTAGTAASVAIVSSGTAAYTSFQDVNANAGASILATNNCTNVSNNHNIIFTHLSRLALGGVG